MRFALVAILVSIGALGLDARGQRFKTGTEAVRVDVLVTDGNRPVNGLTAESFEIRDNGVPQQVTHVANETLPLNLISVLDVSGSVSGEPLAALKNGTVALIDALEGDDRAALISFSHRLHIHSPLTGDKARLRQLVAGVKVDGASAVLDAIFAALALRETDAGRTLLLLFSDGRDTSSWLTARQVLEAARRSDAVIYPVTVDLGATVVNIPLSTGTHLQIPARIRKNDRALDLLAEFADETGGRVVSASGNHALGKTFVDVLAEFRQRYVLSYTPSGVPATGWHAIEVKLRGRKGTVKARRGYFAAP